MNFEIDCSTDIMAIQLYDKADLNGLIYLLHEMIYHPKWNSHMRFFADFQQCDLSTLNHDELYSFAIECETHKDKMGVSKSSFLLNSDVNFGVCRVWLSYIEPHWGVNVNLFRSMDKALPWLLNE